MKTHMNFCTYLPTDIGICFFF